MHIEQSLQRLDRAASALEDEARLPGLRSAVRTRSHQGDVVVPCSREVRFADNNQDVLKRRGDLLGR
jgi:hypothetical protein